MNNSLVREEMACEEAELGSEAFARKMEEVKKFQQQVSTNNCSSGSFGKAY